VAQRFESEPETLRDAMSDAEVKEVLARLSREKLSPQVRDVADIAGASEADVRRILQELRAEQATPVETPPAARMSPFLMGRNQKYVPLAVVSAAALLLLGLLLAFFSASTVAPVQTAAPEPVISGEGPSQDTVATPAEN
jgi:hypothetical protein